MKKTSGLEKRKENMNLNSLRLRTEGKEHEVESQCTRLKKYEIISLFVRATMKRKRGREQQKMPRQLARVYFG